MRSGTSQGCGPDGAGPSIFPAGRSGPGGMGPLTGLSPVHPVHGPDGAGPSRTASRNRMEGPAPSGPHRLPKITSLFLALSTLALTQLAHAAPTITTSIRPLAWILEVLTKRPVTVLMDSRANPHLFELKPSQLDAIAKSQLVVLVGMELEYWAKDLQVKNIAYAADALSDSQKVPGNPHFWLDPELMIVVAEYLKSELCRLPSADCPQLTAASSELTAQLTALSAELKDTIAKWRDKRFLAYHPGWDYFANRFGLVQLAVLQRGHMHEPTLRDMLSALAQVEREVLLDRRLPLLLDATTPSQAVAGLAENPKLAVVVLDTLGRTEESYPDTMRRLVATLARAIE